MMKKRNPKLSGLRFGGAGLRLGYACIRSKRNPRLSGLRFNGPYS
jgi:hypothetical protein